MLQEKNIESRVKSLHRDLHGVFFFPSVGRSVLFLISRLAVTNENVDTRLLQYLHDSFHIKCFVLNSRDVLLKLYP